MRDELFDRDYQAGRAELHDGIDQLLTRLATFLREVGEAQHRVDWSAPWKKDNHRDKAGMA